MKNILLIICLIISGTSPALTNQISNQQLLEHLDSIMENSQNYIIQKEKRIEQIRQMKTSERKQEDIFWINKMFYDEFYVYSADSALKYADENIKIAQSFNNKEWIAEWMLKRVFLLTATGLLKEAGDEFKKINKDSLSENIIPLYYDQKIYLYAHLGQYLGTQKYSSQNYHSTEQEQAKEALKNISKDNKMYYWFKATVYMNKPESKEKDFFKKDLEKKITESGMNTREDAINAYALARIYHYEGNENLYIRFLAYSAIADIKYCNRDIASLEELAAVLFKNNDIDRSYRYINYCLKNALLYPNRVRVVGISSVMDGIQKAYLEKSKVQERRVRISLAVISILSVILLIAIILIILQFRKLAKSRHKLNKANKQLAIANEELNMLNKQLTDTNNKLIESNYVKEEYIGYVFSICSNYISKIEEYRKNISRKLKTGQFEEIRNLTSSSIMVQNELKEFYHNFDAIFLHIYPDFVNDFNNLLKPEEQITVKEGELLNTELRIYALVRLGIHDSVKIADFLHCSPQTVYNNRLKTRNKANIPKEEFAETIKSLGKIKPQNGNSHV